MNISDILLEHQALTAAYDAVRATRLDVTYVFPMEHVKSALANRGVSENILDYVTTEAMVHLTGGESKEPWVMMPPTPVAAHLGETLGLAWVAWTRGQKELALDLLAKVTPPLHERVTFPRQSSGMQIFALTFWAKALNLLVQGNLRESQKLWDRAIEVATVFSLEISLVLRWAYTATFFESPSETR